MQEGFPLQKTTPLQRGTNNTVYFVETSKGELVCKINRAVDFPKMFEREAQGLALLEQSRSFRIPKVYQFGEIEGHAYLLLEKIKTGKKTKAFWTHFAECLAQLHQVTGSHFGLKTDNYIGTLHQYNQNSPSTLPKFYIEKRLLPQFELAHKNGFLLNNIEKLFKTIESRFPNEPPTLIHGDLWSGNYLAAAPHTPVLIDPAVSYGSREMDLAMMRLFGGFSSEVYKVYSQLFPLEPGWKERTEVWQLYYLLVHLNLFGASYLPAVNRILKGNS